MEKPTLKKTSSTTKNLPELNSFVMGFTREIDNVKKIREKKLKSIRHSMIRQKSQFNPKTTKNILNTKTNNFGIRFEITQSDKKALKTTREKSEIASIAKKPANKTNLKPRASENVTAEKGIHKHKNKLELEYQSELTETDKITEIIHRMKNLLKLSSEIYNIKSNSHPQVNMILDQIDTLNNKCAEQYLKIQYENSTQKDKNSSFSTMYNSNFSTNESFKNTDNIISITSERRLSIYNKCFEICFENIKDIVEMINKLTKNNKQVGNPNLELKKKPTTTLLNFNMANKSNIKRGDKLISIKKNDSMNFNSEQSSFVDHSHNYSNINEGLTNVFIPSSMIRNVQKPDEELINLNIDDGYKYLKIFQEFNFLPEDSYLKNYNIADKDAEKKLKIRSSTMIFPTYKCKNVLQVS